jgi:hypothetical protein
MNMKNTIPYYTSATKAAGGAVAKQHGTVHCNVGGSTSALSGIIQ